MSTYVVGDIHGHYDEWIELKTTIENKDSNARFILVGDIIDRGPKTLNMVQWVIKNITATGKYQMIMGNHEEEKIKWWNNHFLPMARQYQFEGREVNLYIVSPDRFEFSTNYIRANKSYKEMYTAIKWFSTLPYYKDIIINNRRFIIVHANLPYAAIDENDNIIKHKLLSANAKDFMLWNRDVDNIEKIPNSLIIHGHNATVFPDSFNSKDFTPNKLGKVYVQSHKINIDCGLVYRNNFGYGNLAAICLDTLEIIYLYRK